MKLCFKNITIFIGEDFTNHDELNLIIENNLDQIALLYPEEHTNKKHESSKLKTLIILDGTWRKTFKIFSLSSNLHTLPRVSFKENFESLYRIRNSTKRNSLSTLEATNLALKEIEPSLETGTLNHLFIKMINFQIEKMGDEIFHKNYSKKKGSD
jgi:DTW domain-containing protein YfiP